MRESSFARRLEESLATVGHRTAQPPAGGGGAMLAELIRHYAGKPWHVGEHELAAIAANPDDRAALDRIGSRHGHGLANAIVRFVRSGGKADPQPPGDFEDDYWGR